MQRKTLSSRALVATAIVAFGSLLVAGGMLTVLRPAVPSSARTVWAADGTARTGTPQRDATPAPAGDDTGTPTSTASGTRTVGKVRLELTDHGFVPDRFEFAVGQDIEVTLVNSGTRIHNFSIERLQIDEDVPAGQTKTMKISAPRRLGHYQFFSDTPDDRAAEMLSIMNIFI